MESVINWPILSNPANWIIIALILIFACYAAMAVTSRL
jgi:hypothetical protein